MSSKVETPFEPKIISAEEVETVRDLALPTDLSSLARQLADEARYLAERYPPIIERRLGWRCRLALVLRRGPALAGLTAAALVVALTAGIVARSWPTGPLMKGNDASRDDAVAAPSPAADAAPTVDVLAREDKARVRIRVGTVLRHIEAGGVSGEDSAALFRDLSPPEQEALIDLFEADEACGQCRLKF